MSRYLMLDVNMRGVFLAIQASVARMRDGGRVVTIGSNMAVRAGSPGSSVYAMTKASSRPLESGSLTRQPGACRSVPLIAT